MAFTRSSLTEEQATRATREYLGREVLGRLVAELNPDYQFPELRALLITATLYGVGMARFVTDTGPVARSTVDLLVWYLGPSVQQILDCPLPPDELIAAQVAVGITPAHPERVAAAVVSPAEQREPSGARR